MDQGKKQRAMVLCSEFMRRVVHGVLGVCVGRWRVAFQSEMTAVKINILKKQHAKELSHNEMDNATRLMLRTTQERQGRALTIMRHMVHVMISHRRQLLSYVYFFCLVSRLALLAVGVDVSGTGVRTQ